MTSTDIPSRDPSPGLANRVARLLRHEIGDLLQSIYATTAILLDRLPAPLTHERRLISDLKSRAEVCRSELDAIVELVSPVSMNTARVDLAPLLCTALAGVRRRFPALAIQFECGSGLLVQADAHGLTGMLNLLLLAVGQDAKEAFTVQARRVDARVQCTIGRDGFGVHAEQLAWLQRPFASTQQALLGLALALMRRQLDACRGTFEVANGEKEGISVEMWFPAANP